MEYKIITPMMLWQDFNPMKEPLEVTVDKVTSAENYVSKEMTFTVESASDGKIRAYANVVVQKNKVAPTILFVPTGEATIKKSKFFDILIERGFNFISVDYGGKATGKERFTVYPESLSYCNFAENRALPYEPTAAAKSPWFVWMKVIRRAITLAFEEANVDKSKLVLLGYIEGAQLAWKVAGIDGRVRAVIPVGACGYTEYFNTRKYAENTTAQLSDEYDCWLAGISTQTYAKMIMCPVYYAAGTNSTYADIDRVNDLFNLIPAKEKYMSFSAGTNNSITFGAFTGAVCWTEKMLEGDSVIAVPKFKTYISDGRLYASVSEIKDYQKVEIYYALDELNPAFRSWTLAKQQTALSKDEVLAVLSPRESSERIFVYATVTFKDGIVLSTPETSLDLTKISLEEYETASKGVSRFVYSADMETIPFSVENYNPIVDENIIKTVTGPMNLKGVTVTEGKLCTYNIEPPYTRNDEDYLLQMEVFSETPRDIDIILYTAENSSTKYKFTARLIGMKKWQRLSLKRSDFKTADNKQLKEWRFARKMKIKNAENVLFNSILWI